MKLYISAATLQTIQRYGHASLTQISATPDKHMCVEFDQTAEAQDQRALIRELQKALFYWMPSIAGEDSPAGQKAAEHAYLLIGLDDNSMDCEGDRMMASLRIRNQALERIELACQDAGCPEGMDFADFIASLEPADSGECDSCVEGKCVTGDRCVTLGRDSCAYCNNKGYLAGGNHCQWCAQPV